MGISCCHSRTKVLQFVNHVWVLWPLMKSELNCSMFDSVLLCLLASSVPSLAAVHFPSQSLQWPGAGGLPAEPVRGAAGETEEGRRPQLDKPKWRGAVVPPGRWRGERLRRHVALLCFQNVLLIKPKAVSNSKAFKRPSGTSKRPPSSNPTLISRTRFCDWEHSSFWKRWKQIWPQHGCQNPQTPYLHYTPEHLSHDQQTTLHTCHVELHSLKEMISNAS